MKDFYNVLGVSKTATDAEIKKAYRNLSKIHHPDKGGNEEKFKEINEAFSTLGDAAKRMQYDNPPQQHKFEDFFQHFGFSNGFEFNFSGGNPFQQSRTPQEDLNIVIEHYISFKDIYNDTQQEVSYERFVQCQSCDATGLDHNSDFEECKTCDGSGKHPQYGSNVPCPDCNGQGGKYQKKCQRCNGNKLISRTEKVTVNNVYSLTAPQTMNYRGMGHYSQYEHGRRGDAIIQFIPAVLEGYTRQHANLYYKMPIHFSDAITGVHMPYEHVDGKKINVKLPANTKNGEKLKLSGLGLLQPDKRGRGDLLIEVDIMIDYDRLNKEADTK